MVRFVLVPDRTLMSKYRNVPLGDFLGCVPAKFVPPHIFYFLCKIEPPLPDGRARVAPYGLRKVEAALVKGGIPKKHVVVAHPDCVHYFIDEDTQIVGIHTMDPLGLGPVSMMFTVGHKYISYDELEFKKLIIRINLIRKRRGLRFKIVVGGPGAWQLEYRKGEMKRLGIDHVIIGETEHVIVSLFESIARGDAPEIIHVKTWPKVEEIPTIINPSIKGLVEIMRGCGRGCRWCLPNLRTARYMPEEKIIEEILLNLKHGETHAWIHSEDVFLYKVEDKINLFPNREAVVNLFKEISKLKKCGLKYFNPTHSSIAPVVADPEMIRQLTETIWSVSGKGKWIGIQPGLETGSPKLIKMHMPNKPKPFSAEEWQDIAVGATCIFNENYWFPAYTLIVGMPGETEDDAWMTVEMLARMEYEIPRRVGKEKAHFVTAPLAFVPLAALKGQKFWDADKELTEARFAVIYRAWRIILKEVYKSLYSLVEQPPHIKLLVNLVSWLGSSLILRRLEKYGKRRGFNVEKVLAIRP